MEQNNQSALTLLQDPQMKSLMKEAARTLYADVQKFFDEVAEELRGPGKHGATVIANGKIQDGFHNNFRPRLAFFDRYLSQVYTTYEQSGNKGNYQTGDYGSSLAGARNQIDYILTQVHLL